MTANELADVLEQRSVNYTYNGFYNKQAATMLRQQAQEIEALKKELALQKLSDISQEIEDRDSAIYATGYWNGIAKVKPRELTDEEIVFCMGNLPKFHDEISDKDLIDFARAILKKASERA